MERDLKGQMEGVMTSCIGTGIEVVRRGIATHSRRSDSSHTGQD